MGTKTVKDKRGATSRKKGQAGRSGKAVDRPQMDEKLIARIKALSVQAVDVLAEIINNPKVRTGDRVKAAGLILDRTYGKPTQPIDAELSGSLQVEILLPEEVGELAE